MKTNRVTLRSVRTGKSQSLLVRTGSIPSMEYLVIPLMEYESIKSVICDGDRPIIQRLDGYEPWVQQVNGNWISLKV